MFALRVSLVSAGVRSVVRSAMPRAVRSSGRACLSSTSNSSFTKSELSLSQELNHEIAEEEDYEAPDELAELEASLDNFTIDRDTEPTASLMTTLVRSTENELVEVTFNAGDLVMTPLPVGDDNDNDSDDGEESVVSVPFQVTVAKSSVEDRVLTFDCEATEEGVQVHRIRMERDVEDDSGEDVDDDEDGAIDDDEEGEGGARLGATQDYEGPVFEDLEESLQDQFLEYLAARGVDANMASYIVMSSQHREQMAYINWLCEVDDFVRADEETE